MDKWNLDDAFFGALSTWTLDHPGRPLEGVLMSVSDAIDQGKDIVEVIPDALFPIRGFIKSVACVFQLGVKIWTAQRDVQNFAVDILNWVNRVKESFDQAGEGRFTMMTWRNLSQIRDLIDEICTWAAGRLKDKRWSVESLRIKKEIDEFRNRMDEARKLFNDRSLIVVSGSLGSMHQVVQATLFGQSTIVAALDNLKETLDSQFEQEERRFVEDKLRNRVAEDPSYTTQNKKPCLPGTRHEILDEIKQWIHDDSQDVLQNFLWIFGPPGCGKSAITASIAEYCQSQNNLGGQFFISHANRNTTNPLFYFPTIIRDLYKRSDSVERHLYDALKERRFSVDTLEKASQLFLETIQKAASDNSNAPVVVIFDGLDETSSYHDVSDQTRRENLENTAAIFSDLFAKLSHHRNAKIIISSRPEAEILRQFKDSTHGQHIKELNIRTDDEASHQDIKAFLEHRLGQIAKKYLLPPVVWPKGEHLEQLARQSSGLFIWAVTVCNYIDASLRLHGTEDPDAVFVEFNEDLVDLTKLYTRILAFSYSNQAAKEWTFEAFRRIMGSLMVIREPMNLRDLTAFLDLRRISKSTRADIRNFVENLRTLLVPDSGEVTEATIPQAHKSFFDFLTSRGDSFSAPFRINVDTANAEIAFTCLHHIIAAYPEIHATHFASKDSDLRVLSPVALYAVRFVLSHMPRQDGESMGVVSNHPNIREISQLGEILRRSSHQNSVGPLVFSLQSNPTFLRTSFDNHTLLWNPGNGSVTSPISNYPHWQPQQFSRDGSRILLEELQTLYSIPRHSYDLRRKSLLITLTPPDTPTRPHYVWGGVNFAVSFDGKDIIICDGDGQVSLHSADSGVLRAELPQRHQNETTSIHISQTGSYVASASDQSVEVWDFRNGCYITEPNVIQHDSEVVAVLLSPDETLLLTYTLERVHIWEVSPCRQLYTFAFETDSNHSMSTIAFSPDSQLILGGSKDNTVHLWKARTGAQICDPWTAGNGIEGGPIFAVDFRSCGNFTFTISSNNLLQVWDVHQASLLMVIPDADDAVFTLDGSQLICACHRIEEEWVKRMIPELQIYNLAPILLDFTNTFKPKWTTLSPGGTLVVSAATDQILCWRLDAIKVVGEPLQGVSNFIVVVAFSADELRIAGVSEDGTLYLWDSTTQELLSSLPECAPGASSLSFSPEGTYIEAICADNRSVVLKVVGDELAVSDGEETVNSAQQMRLFPKSSYFDTDKPAVTFGTDPAARNRQLEGVHWYPSGSTSVAWAYIDDHIVRVGQDGSIVVVAVGDAQCK
ncbi:hypothetical protein DXG01_014503 [Tephrocybe rancida]|nr:hypothetical protein DXG01_014503 [Tephrocybe rancida]